MRYNQLGRTGLYVSELCLGAMTFGGGQTGGIWGAVGAVFTVWIPRYIR